MAFGSTLAREQTFPESTWHERAAGGASGSDRVTFVAEEAGRLVGMATGVARHPDDPDHVRFEGVPGEFSQHDFGQADVRYGDGRTERVHFFASRLKWSRAVDVRLVPNEQEEALVRALLHSFEAFGGIPLVTVWDNPKTVVQARQGDLIVWNAVFGQVALDYRFAPELCWPRAAQQKGAVEQLVGWVKRSFFACRRFHDRADLERQLTAWLLDVNTVRPSRATGVIPAVRLAEEQLRLRPLPIAPPAYALKIPVVVSAQGRVRHAGVEYSMPADTLGQTATLHLYEDRLEIVTKAGTIVPHPRRSRGASILPEHRAALLDRVHGARGQLYFQRQSLWEARGSGRGLAHRTGAPSAGALAARRRSLLRAAARLRARRAAGGLRLGCPARRHRRRVRPHPPGDPAGRGQRVSAAPAIDLDALLRRLHLPTVRRLYPDLATRAESEDMAYRDYLAVLMAEEVSPMLIGMFVDSTQRGRGVGAALVESVTEWARTLAAEDLYLWATSTNQPAIALYEKCGFRPNRGRATPCTYTIVA